MGFGGSGFVSGVGGSGFVSGVGGVTTVGFGGRGLASVGFGGSGFGGSGFAADSDTTGFGRAGTGGVDFLEKSTEGTSNGLPPEDAGLDDFTTGGIGAPLVCFFLGTVRGNELFAERLCRQRHEQQQNTTTATTTPHTTHTHVQTPLEPPSSRTFTTTPSTLSVFTSYHLPLYFALYCFASNWLKPPISPLYRYSPRL